MPFCSYHGLSQPSESHAVVSTRDSSFCEEVCPSVETVALVLEGVSHFPTLHGHTGSGGDSNGDQLKTEAKFGVRSLSIATLRE